METNPLRSLFGVSSPRMEAQRAAPQPAAPTENICFEFPSGMLEKLLANPFTGWNITSRLASDLCRLSLWFI